MDEVDEGHKSVRETGGCQGLWICGNGEKLLTVSRVLLWSDEMFWNQKEVVVTKHFICIK